jgi:hypothetical protein
MLIVTLGIISLLYIAKTLVGEHGTVSSVSVLQREYNKAGPEIATTFTNSLIQKFPFDGPINWTFSFFKDPFVALSGKVDTNKLHQFIIDNPSTHFGWSGIDKNGKNWFAGDSWPTAEENSTITWDSMFFRSPNAGTEDAEKYSGFIDGTVEFPSCKVVIISR